MAVSLQSLVNNCRISAQLIAYHRQSLPVGGYCCLRNVFVIPELWRCIAKRLPVALNRFEDDLLVCPQFLVRKQQRKACASHCLNHHHSVSSKGS